MLVLVLVFHLATALLFPIDWPEPFGLVMIEAMAAGTPVIAWRNDSTPEVIEQGVANVHGRVVREHRVPANTCRITSAFSAGEPPRSSSGSQRRQAR